MATIRDIASLAGVSPATISRYLNGQITVREETQRRIEHAVQELNYKPNFLARSLVLKETQTLGVIIPDILNPYYSGLARGVEDEAQRTGWSVVLCNSDNSVDKELHYVQMLRYKQVDGIVLVSSGHSGEHLREMLDSELELVIASRRLDDIDADSVTIANAKGAFEATNHLVRLGHRRIAMIGGSLFLSTGRERLEGYRRALIEAGILIDDRLIITDGTFQYQAGYSGMRRLLRRSAPPTAVFAGNDLIAAGVANAVLSLGRTVPGDVAVVGFDGIPLGEMINPRLTTMAVRPYEVGRTSCRLLLDRVARKKSPPSRHITIEPCLEIRESCGAVRPGSADTAQLQQRITKRIVETD